MDEEKMSLECEELQGEIDRLEYSRKGLMTQNDALHKENKTLLKENKGLQEDNSDVAIRISRQKAVLKTVEDNLEVINTDICLSKKAAQVTIDQSVDEQKTLQGFIAENEGKLTTLDERIRVIEGKRESLNFVTKELNKGMDSVNAQLKENETARNELKIEQDKAVRLVAEKQESLEKAELARKMVEANIVESVKLKNEIYDTQSETKKIHHETLSVQKDMNTSRKQLDRLVVDAKKAMEAVEARESKIEGKKKGIAREYKELKLEEQRIETMNLRVRKLIRDKKVVRDLNELKKDIGA